MGEVPEALALLQKVAQPDPSPRERHPPRPQSRESVANSLLVALFDGSELGHGLAMPGDHETLSIAHSLEQSGEVRLGFINADPFHGGYRQFWSELV
jgi:hypothetical protein